MEDLYMSNNFNESTFDHKITVFETLSKGDLSIKEKNKKTTLDLFFKTFSPKDEKKSDTSDTSDTNVTGNTKSNNPQRKLIFIFILFILLLLLISLFP